MSAEQSRARYPDADGFIERDGVKIFYEVYGDGRTTVLLLPTWSIMHFPVLEDSRFLTSHAITGSSRSTLEATDARTAR